MMAYKTEASAQFEDDVRSAIRYVELDLNSPNAAKKLRDEVEKAVAFLSELPFARALSRHESLAAQGVRVYFVLNFALAYTVKGDVVYLLRFLHQSQLYESGDYWSDSV